MNKPVLIKVLGSHQLQFEEVFRPVTNYQRGFVLWKCTQSEHMQCSPPKKLKDFVVVFLFLFLFFLDVFQIFSPYKRNFPFLNYISEKKKKKKNLNICLVGVYPVPSSLLVYPLIYIYHPHQSKLPDLGGCFEYLFWLHSKIKGLTWYPHVWCVESR